MKEDTKRPILIVCGAGYVSGKEVVALELGQGLARIGERVLFVTSSWNDGDFLGRLKRAGLPAELMPIGFISATLTRECVRMNFEQICHWPGLVWRYSRALRNLRPTKIVHTNWHHLFLLLPYLQADRDIFWLHEVLPDFLQYRLLFAWLGRKLNCFVCVSRAVANSLRQLGVDEVKIRVIHNGITDIASTQATPNSRRAFRIGIVGQVAAWKGHDDLLEAFALVHKKYTNSELHVFGQGPITYKSCLERRSMDLGIADSVRWHGFVQDPKDIYPNLDLCVVPSRSDDPLPTSAIEAGFSGLPVVATRRGGLPEIIDHEKNGLLVGAQQPTEIAEALSRLIDNPQLRRHLARNARRYAVERFGRERFIQSFASLLKGEELED